VTANDHSKGATLAVLCTVLFVTFLDNTVVSVTLADIQSSLHAGVQVLQWTVNGYALAFASLMLIGGMLGDRFGRKRVMLAGLAVFAGGSALAALAPSAGWLLVGRVVMGVGAAASEPGTLSIIRQVFVDRAARARALGVWAAVSGTALAMGPVVAGILVGLSSWRGVFWFNLALVAVAFAAAVAFVPESSEPGRPPVDLLGGALGAIALAGAIFAVIQGETAGYTTWWVVALFAGSAVAAASFAVVELRRRQPMLDLRLFRRGRFAVANVVAFTTYFGVFSIFFFVALYLQLLADQSPFATAADFVPMTLLMIAAAALTGRWVARVGPRLPMTVGCAVGGIGILLVDAVLGPHAGFAQLSWSLGIAGVGFGIALVPVTSSALSEVPQEHSGMAAAAANTSRELGAVFGVAVLGALVNGELTSSLTRRLQDLGIPANFQSVVIHAVTHGGVPQNSQQAAKVNPAARNAGPIVDKVISAAERAFYSGLHLALVVSASLLLASAVLAWFTFRWAADRRRAPVRAWLEGAVLVALVVGAAVGLEVGLVGRSEPGPGSSATVSSSTTAAGSDSGSGGATPTIHMDPNGPLHDGQQVQITGSGFAAGEHLVALECADRRDRTGAGDCDISHTESVTAGPDGSIRVSVTVRRGPFGSAGRTCGPSQPCEVTVSPPSASASGQRATTPISFGG
jgi:EmrB/QacA subfamily drug resistance transporter